MMCASMAPSKRGEPAKWEPSIDGRLVAWIDARAILGARSVFYRHVAEHPDKGELMDVQRSAKFDDQVEKAPGFSTISLR